MLEVPLISLALFFVALVMFCLGLYALANIKVRGALEFSLLMIALTLYIAGYGMELMSETASGILFWLKVEYFGIATLPVFCLSLAIRLAGQDRWFRHWLVRIAFMLPFVTLVLYFTNTWHHLFYKSIGSVLHISDYHELELEKGVWYYVNILFLNLSLLVSVFLFLRKLQTPGVERQQAWILIGGSLGPWIAHLVYQANLTNGFDISPFGFMLTAPLFAWGVFGNHMVFLIPKARNAVYHSFSDAVIIIDNNHQLVDFNGAAGKLFKDLTRNSIGRSLQGFYEKYPDMGDMANNLENQRMQVRIQIDNVKRTFILTSSIVNTRKSMKLGLILILHEITDQVFLLDNLRESEEKYQLIFENAPVGFLLFDIQGRITTCNESFINLIGSSRDVLLGLNMLQLPDKKLVGAITEAINGKIGYYEGLYNSVTADKITPVRGLFSPLRSKDSMIRGGIGIVEDFSERYAAEQRIKYQEQVENILMTLELDFLNSEIDDIEKTFSDGLGRLGSFFTADEVRVIRIDADAGILSNRYEWLSPDIETSRNSWDYVPIRVIQDWVDQFERSEYVHIPDTHQLHESQSAVKELLISRSLRSYLAVPIQIGGELLGFTSLGKTREPKSWTKEEIALLVVLGQVFGSVIKRKDVHEELISARDRAEEASRVKSAFLANMSHEIRTPLNGILGFAELIQAEFDDPVIQKYADIILSSGSRLLQTLSQILDLSRVESGKMELVLEDVNIDEAIDDVIQLFTPTANKKGLFLERQPGGANFILRVDDQLFRNSLTNLVSNAIKFTQKGGITLSRSIERNNGRNFGVIRITDTGIGIPEAFFSSIFEDFKQVSEGVRRSYEGTGLGLSLTKRFVELSGGSIHVESIHGFGATFIVRFPDPRVIAGN